ncbi:MAG: AMP-binding protein [Rectinemataceae bacterium]|nr:AMP-binding protein [Spirochaetaceae bacterium]
MKRTVLTMLKEAAVKYPDIPYALKKTENGYQPTTFRQTRRAARSFAAWLIGNDIKKGDKLAILAEGSPEWIIAEMGMLSAGVISVPLSIKLLAEEIPFRLVHSEARGICTTHNQLEKVISAIKAANLGKDFYIIYLDDDVEWGQSLARKHKITEDQFIPLRKVLSAGRLLLENTKTYEKRLDELENEIGEQDIVTISYTSGTTGNPKGIMLTHLNYWANCHDAVTLFDNPMFYRTLLILPVDHSFAHTVGLYTALLCGVSLYFVDSRGGGIATLRNIPINLKESNPIFLLTVPSLSGNFMKKIIAAIEEKGGFVEWLFKKGIEAGIRWNGDGYHKPSIMVRAKAFVPYFAAKLLVFNKVKKSLFGNSIKFCVGGGALLDVKQQHFFAALGVPVYQGYGLTEAAPVISSNIPRIYKYGTSGIIAPSVECKIMDEKGTELPRGVIGQITITGDNVMAGYYKNPEATAETLRGGRLWTGDLGYIDEDGFLVVVGREKALLIAEDGEKYSPEEIEEAITSGTDVFDQIMVWCDHKKYATSLVSLEDTKIRRLIQSRQVKTAKDLLKVLTDEFYRFKGNPDAKQVQNAWIPAVFQIIEEGFSEKDGTINSTMKLVRHKAAQVHKDLLEYSYTKEGSMIVNQHNLEVVARKYSLPIE